MWVPFFVSSMCSRFKESTNNDAVIYVGEHNRAFEKVEAGSNRRRSKVPCDLATLASDTSCRILARETIQIS